MMSNEKVILLIITALFALSTGRADAQNTVFNMFRKNIVLADEYFAERKYQSALEMYLRVAGKAGSDARLEIRIARCYYLMRQYDQARNWYAKVFPSGALPPDDLYYHAESLSAMKQYEKAIEVYRAYLKHDQENEFVIKKIWRLDNVLFLYEDSAHYALKTVTINSEYADIAPVPYADGLVFMSNRKTLEVIEQIDASSNTTFFKLYFSKKYSDSLLDVGHIQYTRPELWQMSKVAKFHLGPVSFFSNERKMVFTGTSELAGDNGERVLQLYFAGKQNGEWIQTDPFPYNNPAYSLSDPSISGDGSVLYFSSDMPGGKGGKDLYKSLNFNGEWTHPVNLSDLNTPYDEVSPYIASNQMLYFSSNGHAGLGGLDVYKVAVTNQGFGDVQNLGYPLNTHHDEFAMVIDSLNTHGYFASNRKNRGKDDDIFEFDIDLQTYPLAISGVVKHKEINWSDSAQLTVMPDAKLSLIDNVRNVTVFECISDANGNFRLEVPYFSTYKIKITGHDNHENIVSLEIPKHRRGGESQYEIVVVKDPFKTRNNAPR